MRRLVLVLLALPLAVAAQSSRGDIVHTFDNGLWTITGTDGNDIAEVECNGGMAQVNDTDPSTGAAGCDLAIRIEMRFLGGFDQVFFRGIGVDFDNLDPNDSGLLDGGDDEDEVTIDLSGFGVDLNLDVDAPAVGIPAGADASLTLSDGVGDPIRFGLADRTGTLRFRLGLGDDLLRVSLTSPGPWFGLAVDGNDGDDEVDATGSTVTTDLEFTGGLGADVFRSGLLNTRLRYEIGDGRDVYEGGDGGDDVFITGIQLRMGLHGIRGFLGTGCAYYNFNDDEGVEDDGVDRATISPGTGGGDVFFERECFPRRGVRLGGSTGDDQLLLRGDAGGNGLALDVDFSTQTFLFADGFESGDVSSWTTDSPDLQGDPTWDGMAYQDWPSFTDPNGSGPSTVVIRGEPEFPVTLNMGPDQDTFGGDAPSDSLLIDPMGLAVDDDGSRVLIGNGAPITYTGVDVVVILQSTATEPDPEARASTLSVFPNPAASAARVRLAVAAPGPARVVLLDIRGRVVRVLHEGALGAEAREWSLGGGLAPGVYLVLARGDGWRASRAVVVPDE